MTPPPGAPASPQLLVGSVVLPDRLVADGAVVLVGDRILHAGRRDDPAVPVGAARADLPPDVLLLPGLVDLHCHGGAGGEFGSDRESARRAAEHHHLAGSTTVVASLVSARPAALVTAMRVCAELATEGVVAGVHTEGPFLSPARRGAHDPAALSPVDLGLVDSLADAGDGRWRAMTFAPELDGTAELIRRLVDSGVVPAVGHTDADAATTTAALTRAAGLLGDRRRAVVTHLFNAMPAMHHREPGPVAASLAAAARQEAVVELIADGVHLADATVAMVLDVLGPGSVALVSDAMAATGMPEGRYRIGDLDAVVSAGTARLVDGDAIAGSVSTLLDTVRRCVRHVGAPLPDAVRAASGTPATVLGVDDEVGALRPGLRADVVAVDRGLRPVAVWRAGHRLGPPHAP
ncbi:N-acetylglucosamine-6-phosphate deacetylase [Geodermatophilus maliterrae]|uniref:N-acetylglucosamine-6-phosphate deacetylase n=1 Tax=Geodermatophilus maliterrae TaxID=3162531 RepID=A0ABV3XB78_9ACTN